MKYIPEIKNNEIKNLLIRKFDYVKEIVLIDFLCEAIVSNEINNIKIISDDGKYKDINPKEL